MEILIENGRIMFMTSYLDEFGEERKVANIISKDRLIEMRDNINSVLAELSNGKLISVDKVELLNRYTKFLQKNGYIDADATCEEPFAIDEFLRDDK